MNLLRYFFLFGVVSSGFTLEIQRVILATDDNPFYKEFWPIVAPLYKKMGFTPTLAFIAEEGTPIDLSLGDVIYFPPIRGVSKALQAQAIRLLLPALYPDDGCFVSDIDMILISRDYIVEGAELCPDDAFLVYRDLVASIYPGTYPMCYVAAKGCVFGAVFQVESLEHIRDKLLFWASLGLGWNTDERVLFQSAIAWELSGGRVVRLGHGVSRRLDREAWNFQLDQIDFRDWIDCHCPRPYSQHRQTIDELVQAFDAFISSCPR